MIERTKLKKSMVKDVSTIQLVGNLDISGRITF